jgi:hypothetical protein
MKHFTLIFLFCFLAILPARAQFGYTTNTDGTLTITNYTGPGGNITFPATIDGLPVSGLGTNVIPATNSTVTGITIPGSITNLAAQTFQMCEGITNVILGYGIPIIPNQMCFSCTNLVSVAIPNSVTSIGTNAFNYCISLENVMIPASVTNIPAGAPPIVGSYGDGSPFGSCSRLTNVTILGAPNIGMFAFRNLGKLKNVSIAGGVIQQEAFFDTAVTTLMFGNLPVSLGNYCFQNSPISNLIIPSNVTYIGQFAFENSALTNLVIAAGVGELDANSFYGCFNLTDVLMLGNPPFVPATGASPFIPGRPATVYYLPGTTGWSNTFGQTTSSSGTPTALWNPGINTTDGHFGATNGMFGFNITNGSTTNLPVAILVCTNLLNPVWTPLTNITLTNTYYFTDSQWSNHPNRFYGLGFP